MSEVDDLMVDVMMRGESDAEVAVVRLIHLAEGGQLSATEQKHVLKAVERRIEKVKSDTDLYDFLRRLSGLIDDTSETEATALEQQPQNGENDEQ